MFLSAIRRSIISVGLSSTKSVFLKSLKKDVIKTFATVAAKRSNSNNPTKELIKSLESEIAEQIETAKEEEMIPSVVLKNFSEFLEQGNWKIEHEKDNLMVTMKRRDEKLKADVVVKFDLLEIYNSLYEDSDMMDQEDVDAEEYENDNDQIVNESDESVDDEFNYATLPISVEIKRDSVTGKQLNFECLLEGDSEECEVQIEGVSIKNTNNADDSITYTAPSFDQLDESLQGRFQEFLSSVLGDSQEGLLGFVKEYSVAQEGEMYQKWLGEVRDVLKQ